MNNADDRSLALLHFIMKDDVVVKVSNRQRQIIEILLEQTNEMTVADIAQTIHVSPRTVHRELAEIEVILEAFGISLLKKAGIGIQIYANEDQLRNLEIQLANMETTEYTAEERKVLILCKLLDHDEPIKLFAISHDLQAAIPTISNDLDELESRIRKHGLSLVRRRGYGVEIVGLERAKRKAIVTLAQDYLDDSILFGSADSVSDPISRRLLTMVEREQFFLIEKALWKIEEKYPTTLTEGAYTYLLIRLSVAITRARRGKLMRPEELMNNERKVSIEDKRLYDYFAELVQLDLPPQEEVDIMYLLKEWSENNNLEQGIPFHEDLKQLEFVTNLIRYVGDELAVDFEQDRSLKEGLLQHVTPILLRLENDEHIRNPLLSQIKKDYESLFVIVKSAVRYIATEFVIPDEEVGFLVMHFGASLVRIQQLPRRVKALLVCTSGIGSSKLLAVRIEKELPQIELLAHISWFEATRISEEDYDLVISTVDLPLPSDQYFKLSPLLTKDEVEKLRRFIQNITLKRIPKRDRREDQQPPSSFRWLGNIERYLQVIVRLIEQFEVHQVSLFPHNEQADLGPIVQHMCKVLSDQRKLNQIQPIIERLLAREQLGSQVLLPNSELALFHTRSEAVLAPTITLFRYDRPIHLQGMNDPQIRQILLMLGPMEMDRQTLEVLSEISAMLLESSVIHSLETQDEEAVKQLLSNKFSNFIQTKLDWRG
ncbi:MAG: BglG family transcription antiterminator [Paenibacillaceae bacterium]